MKNTLFLFLTVTFMSTSFSYAQTPAAKSPCAKVVQIYAEHHSKVLAEVANRLNAAVNGMENFYYYIVAGRRNEIQNAYKQLITDVSDLQITNAVSLRDTIKVMRDVYPECFM